MSSSNASLLDDLKTLIEKEYKRKLRHLQVNRQAEKKWTLRNQTKHFPCLQCVKLGRQCKLYKTRGRCIQCKDMECSRQHQDMFERVQLQSRDEVIARADFDRLLEEVLSNLNVTRPLTIKIGPSRSRKADSDSASTSGGKEHGGSSIANVPENSSAKTASCSDSAIASPGPSPQEKDRANATPIQELDAVHLTLTATLEDRERTIRELESKLGLELNSNAQLKKALEEADRKTKESEETARMLCEELERIKGTIDHSCRESSRMKDALPVCEEGHRHRSVLQETQTKRMEELARENDRLARKSDDLARRHTEKAHQWQEEKRLMIESSECKNERSRTKLAGLRQTLAMHDQEQSSRAVIMYTTLASLSLKLGECLSTPGNPHLKQRATIVYKSMKELSEETQKWLPSKPSQIISLMRSGVKNEEEEMGLDDEDAFNRDNDEDGDGSGSGIERPVHHTQPYTPYTPPSRKRPRVD